MSAWPLSVSLHLWHIPCPNVFWNWVRYITAAYLPLTLLYLVIVTMKINVVSSPEITKKHWKRSAVNRISGGGRWDGIWAVGTCPCFLLRHTLPMQPRHSIPPTFISKKNHNRMFGQVYRCMHRKKGSVGGTIWWHVGLHNKPIIWCCVFTALGPNCKIKLLWGRKYHVVVWGYAVSVL